MSINIHIRLHSLLGNIPHLNNLGEGEGGECSYLAIMTEVLNLVGGGGGGRGGGRVAMCIVCSLGAGIP